MTQLFGTDGIRGKANEWPVASAGQTMGNEGGLVDVKSSKAAKQHADGICLAVKETIGA